MPKSNRSKSSERIIGKGEVTPIQVAFLVDRYLCDNRFLKTRSLFRSEASSLISNSPVREVPNSLIPLNEILNEYIRLKEEKMVIDQEKAKLNQEKTRVQNLLHGMQDVITCLSCLRINIYLLPNRRKWFLNWASRVVKDELIWPQKELNIIGKELLKIDFFYKVLTTLRKRLGKELKAE